MVLFETSRPLAPGPRPRSRALVFALTGASLFATVLGCVQRPDPVAIWARECASCHGEDGRGDPRRLPLSPELDLHRSAMVQQQARGPIYRVIRQGYGGMPGFDHRLEHDEIVATVTYVLELVEQHPAQE